MILAIIPEILLLILIGFIVLFDAIWKPERKRILGWLTAGGLLVIMVVTFIAGRPPMESRSVWGGMLRQDWYSFAFTLLFMFGAAITSLFAMNYEDLGERGEFYVLMLVSTMGMSLMASAADIIMLYLAIETTSIPLYILVGFITRNEKSVEAGFKYLLFGAAASAVMLYGFSLLYGFTGETSLSGIALGLNATGFPNLAVVGSLLLLLVGFSFKISAFPFHFWAPDVYEGAPTPVTGFLSTASKAAGFAVLIRVLMQAYLPGAVNEWPLVLAVISVLTMTIGNLLALAQKNIKRMLAYSSIAHAGNILIGVVATSALGLVSVVFYLIAYLITNLAAFGIVTTVSNVTGSDEIASYAGLSRRKPGLALAMMVALLSLAGMPPLAGFVAKVFVFAAAVQSGYVWLAFVGILNSIIGLYYYLTVLKVVYLYRSDDEEKPLAISWSYGIALVILIAGILVLGIAFSPWFNWSINIAASLF